MTSDIVEPGGGAANGVRGWINDKIQAAVNSSAPEALVIGCATGWCTGVVCKKVGSTAAAALGGSLIIFRIAEHLGYVKINWKKVDKELDKAKNKLSKKQTQREFQGILKEITIFTKNNSFLATGFGGGFCLGLVTF